MADMKEKAQEIEILLAGEDSMLRRVHPKKRSVSWVNSVLRQFLPNGSSFASHPAKGLHVIVSSFSQGISRAKDVVMDLSWMSSRFHG